MKRTLIATLVGALIIFVYQSLSWMALPVHTNSFKRTPAQDSILGTLSSQLTQDGMYYMPMPPEGASHEEAEKMMKDCTGKPWALISYHRALDYDMAKNMIIGLLLNILAAWIVVYILTKAAGIFSTFSSRVWITFLIYVLVVAQSPLMEWNWLSSPMHYISGEIIDGLVGGLLLGIWLGWYMGRAPKAA